MWTHELKTQPFLWFFFFSPNFLVIFIYLFIFENLANRGNFPIQNPVYNSTLNHFFLVKHLPTLTPPPPPPCPPPKEKKNSTSTTAWGPNKTKQKLLFTKLAWQYQWCLAKNKQNKQNEMKELQFYEVYKTSLIEIFKVVT